MRYRMAAHFRSTLPAHICNNKCTIEVVGHGGHHRYQGAPRPWRYRVLVLAGASVVGGRDPLITPPMHVSPQYNIAEYIQFQSLSSCYGVRIYDAFDATQSL